MYDTELIAIGIMWLLFIHAIHKWKKKAEKVKKSDAKADPE